MKLDDAKKRAYIDELICPFCGEKGFHHIETFDLNRVDLCYQRLSCAACDGEVLLTFKLCDVEEAESAMNAPETEEDWACSKIDKDA